MDIAPLKYFDSLYPPSTREREIKALIPFIEQGLSSQIVGLPGSGKSNILRLLAYNKDVRTHNFGEYESTLHYVYVDCSEIKGRPLFDITKFIIHSLAFSLGERRMLEESKTISEYLREDIQLNDELMLFQTLKKSLDYLSIEKKLTIHLLFDKFDVQLSTIDAQFFTNLRVLRNHAKYRFASVFSLTRPLEDTLDPLLFADYHDIVAGNIVYVTLFDTIGIDFRLSYIEKAARKELPADLKERVLALTGGHAKLTKLSYEALVAEENMPENIEDFLLSRSPIQGGLYEIWNSLLPLEQKLLKSAASFDQIKDQGPYLSNSGLITESGIAIPLFSRYIAKLQLETNERVTYDENKNEILLGDTPLSDRLSPSEFKLLRYLVQNKDTLLPKDDIINAVWGDQKSQEGVTDQALDQIFYRLRKKIEQDPTNPHYILTVKGKGYKLID